MKHNPFSDLTTAQSSPTTTHDNDDDEVTIAVAVAVAEPAGVRVPKPSKELLAVVTPLCQAHAQQHGKEFGAAVNDLVQWAITEAPKYNMTWEVFIRAYVAHLAAEEEASRNQNNLLPTPLKKDQETTTTKVETTSSSCSNEYSNAATHDNKTMELLISRLEKVATSVESDRSAEISMLKSSLEEAREQHEKETSSLRKELDELRGWDTVNATWKISRFDYSTDSSTFNVAQYTMRIQMKVSGDKRYGYLGFYICHMAGHGYDRVPIQLDGSSISVVGNENKDTETKLFFPNSVIEEAGGARGHQDFVARKDLEKKFIENGMLTLEVKIRVRRSTVANLNLK